MEIVLTIFQQILLMFVFMAIGFILFKKEMLTRQGSKELGSLLLYVILPAVIMKSYLIDFSWELLRGLGISFGTAFITLVVSMIISRLGFGKKYPMEQFSSAFSNAGFIGIPLVKMVFDDSMAVFYVASFVAILNVLQWTYGLLVITESKEYIHPQKLLKNPIIISFVIGIMLFILPIQLPELVIKGVDGIAVLNAPIAMIILGTYLAQMKLKDLFTDGIVYRCSLFRLVLIPLITILVLTVLPGNELLKMSILIVAATPVGSNVAIFAQMCGKDYVQATKDICLSTIFCIVTIPVIVGIANMVW